MSPEAPRYSGWVELPTTRQLLHAYVPVVLSKSVWAKLLPMDELWPAHGANPGRDTLDLPESLSARLSYTRTVKEERDARSTAATNEGAPETIGHWDYAPPETSVAVAVAMRTSDLAWSLACYQDCARAPPAWYTALCLRLNVLYELDAQLTNRLYMQSTDRERLQRLEDEAVTSDDPSRIAEALASTSNIAGAISELGLRESTAAAPSADANSSVAASRSTGRVRSRLSAGSTAASVAAGGTQTDTLRTGGAAASARAGAGSAEGGGTKKSVTAGQRPTYLRTTLPRASAHTRAYDMECGRDHRARAEGLLEGKRIGRLERAQEQARITYTLTLLRRLIESYTGVAAAMYRATEEGTRALRQAELEADPALAAAWHGWKAPYVYHPRDSAHARWVLWHQPARVPSALSVLVDGCGGAAHGLHEGFDALIRAFQHLEHPRHAALRAWYEETRRMYWGADPILPDLPVDAGGLPPPATHAVFWATVRSVWVLERLRPEHYGAAVACDMTSPPDPRLNPSAEGWWPAWVSPDLVGATIQRRLTAFMPLAQYFAREPEAAWGDATVPYALIRPAAALEWVAGTARWGPTFAPHVRDINFRYQAEKLHNSVLVMLEKSLPFRSASRSMDKMVVERARRDGEFARVLQDLAQAAFLGLEHDPAAAPVLPLEQPSSPEALVALALEYESTLLDPARGYRHPPASPRPGFAAMLRLQREVFSPLDRTVELPQWQKRLDDAYKRECERYRTRARRRRPKPPPKVNPTHERLFYFIVEALPVAADNRPNSKLWTYVTREFLIRLVRMQPFLRQSQTLSWDALERVTASAMRTLRRTLHAQLARPRPLPGTSVFLNIPAAHSAMAQAVKEFENKVTLNIIRTPKQTFIERLHTILTQCLVDRRMMAMLVRDYIEQVRDLIDPPDADTASDHSARPELLPDLTRPAVLRAALPEKELVTALLDHAWPRPPPPETACPPAWAATEAGREGWATWLAQRTRMSGASQAVAAYQHTMQAVKDRNASLAKLIAQRTNSLKKPRLATIKKGEEWKSELEAANREREKNDAHLVYLADVIRAYLGARMQLQAPLSARDVPDAMQLSLDTLLPHVLAQQDQPRRFLAWTLARYAETQRRVLATLEYEISPEEKTWVWRYMSGMSLGATAEERAAQQTAFANWLIPPLDEACDRADDGGVTALFAQLCDLYENSASDPKMLQVARQIPTLPQTHLAFAAQIRKMLDSVQLVPLPGAVSMQQARAMRSQRYALMPGEYMPPRVWHVYVTFCCNRVATYAYQNGIGHKNILYDVQHDRMTCGIRKRRGAAHASGAKSAPEAAAASATGSKTHDGHKNATDQRRRKKKGGKKKRKTRAGDDDIEPASNDDDHSDVDADDPDVMRVDAEDEELDAATAALLQGGAFGAYAYPVEDDSDTDEDDPHAAKTGDPTARPRGWRPPASGKYKRFSSMPEKHQRKEARVAHQNAQRIECGQSPPVMCINLWGYLLLHGSGFENLRAYQHCPRCGRFHLRTAATATYGGYACDHCRRERAPPLIVERRCARCRKPVPNVPHEHARAVVFLDDPGAPVRTLWWCKRHRPWISAKKKTGLFYDTHIEYLQRKLLRSHGLPTGPLTNEQKRYQALARRRDRERYSARGRRNSQWQ